MTAKTMKWARLGDYIRELDERNGGGKYLIIRVLTS